MATTNHTPTIELSQYVSTDKTSYLVNYNDDMLKIDGAIATDRDNINTAQNTADTAEGKADTNKLSIDAINAELNDPSTGLAPRVAANTGSINTINSLIGNGEPTTTDKTIIGAINEINGKIVEGNVVSIVDGVIESTADGVKTLKDLLHELGVATLALASSLNNGESIIVTCLKGTAIGTSKICTNEVVLTNQSANLFVRTFSCAMSSTVMDNEIANVSETLTNCTSLRARTTYADGTTAYSNLGEVVPTSGYIAALHYRKLVPIG